jgi:hypothetical protein
MTLGDQSAAGLIQVAGNKYAPPSTPPITDSHIAFSKRFAFHRGCARNRLQLLKRLLVPKL